MDCLFIRLRGLVALAESGLDSALEEIAARPRLGVLTGWASEPEPVLSVSFRC